MRSRVAGAVLLMRSALLMLAPALALARLDRVAAQTVERTDTPTAERLKASYTLVDEVPFDFSRRRMSVVVKDESGKHFLISKGAVAES